MRTIFPQQLIETIHDLPYGTGIYTDMTRWPGEPLTTPLYLATREDEDEEDFDDQLEASGLTELFRRTTLEDIVDTERRKRPHGTLEDLVAAAKYYREYDDFRP